MGFWFNNPKYRKKRNVGYKSSRVSKKKALKLSQDGHKRAHDKAVRLEKTNDMYWVTRMYHYQVMERQEKEQRILTNAEKKKIYNSCHYFFWN